MQRVKFANELNTEEGTRCVHNSKTDGQGEIRCCWSKLLENVQGEIVTDGED